nr:ABC transporter permease subunit [Sporichthyaceae bacterium]
LVRHSFRGKRVLNALIDLPIAVSPVIVGLALILVYGRTTGVGRALAGIGINVIFSIPGMVMATIFVCIPLVVRAVAPVLEEIGDEQEQAAATLGAGPVQTFLRIRLPSIRGALAYGVVLALARSLGEYGAVAVVSGRLVGRTQTVTLLVQERYLNFDQETAYACALLLVVTAVVALIISRALAPKEITK